MKKSTLTQDKAKNSPAGGVVVGKRNGQTMIYDDASVGGYFVGKLHSEGGIKMINKSTGQPLEVQGSEVIITAPAVADQTKNEFNGKMMTNREILSQINVKGGGVAFAKDGMEIPKNIRRTGASYNYGGKTMTDHEIYRHITKRQKQSLVRDAKSGNTPARDLNNYNDVIDLQADNMVGADTGLYATGGSVGVEINNPALKDVESTTKALENLSKIGVEINIPYKDKFADGKEFFINLSKPIEYTDFSGTKRSGFKGLANSIVPYEVVAEAYHKAKVDGSNPELVKAIENIFKTSNPDIRYDDGGNVKPYDANMEGDSADMVYARGGATDVIVNNWSDVPDSFKNVRLPKQIDWSPNPSNEGLYEIVKPFLGVEDLRPAMQGMNFDDNGITITNAHILLTIPTGEQSFDGIYKKDKSEDGFTKIDAKYPNYLQVIPTEKDITKVFQFINTDKLLIYCKVASKYTKGIITFKINDEQMSFTPEYIIGLISSWIKLTGLSYAFVSFQTNKRALVFSGNPTFKLGKDRFALLMPYIYGTGEKLGARNESKKAELNVYFDFDDNEIHNSDGSVVDLQDKPKKERAKRTPKTTPSKTSTQKGKILIKEELEQSKIWIGDNLDLRDLVMAKLNQIGFAIDKDYGDKDLSTKKGIHIRIYTDDFVLYGDESKTYFDKMEVKEIFESDLFPTALTPTADTEKTEVFKLIGIADDGISSTTGIYGATELLQNLKLLESKFTEKQNFPFRIYDFMGVGYDTLNIGRGIKTPSELITYIMSKPYYKDYDWAEFFAFGTEITLETTGKFSDGEIDAFNQIDAIVDSQDIEFIDITSWGKDLISKTTDFNIVNKLTGEVFGLRKYNKSLGVQEEDIEKGKSRALIKDYLEFKKSIPTATEKPIEQPKPSKTDKPKRNFELERKYLSQRISDLAKELELKKPILSNEEVAFYQREINSFILKLRKLNDAEMSLKSIEQRVRGVYDLKISSFENQYPETDMTSVNALKSQLTEKEYFNVRTPEFKSFFGDWETAYLTDSYAGVSKAINPITKEPQPVFHGTNVLFVDWKTYDSNNAHYFAVKREMSEFFATSWEQRSDKAGVDSEILKKLNPNRGSFLLRCFIDIKNPVDFSRFGVDKYPIREYLTFLRVNYNIGDFDFWTNITSHSGFTQDTEVYAWQIIRLWQSFIKYIKVFTMYDGYIFYEYIPTKPYGGLENASLSYCAFESNQIKFTDAYEFNALSNDSRFDLGGIL